MNIPLCIYHFLQYKHYSEGCQFIIGFLPNIFPNKILIMWLIVSYCKTCHVNQISGLDRRFCLYFLDFRVRNAFLRLHKLPYVHNSDKRNVSRKGCSVAYLSRIRCQPEPSVFPTLLHPEEVCIRRSAFQGKVQHPPPSPLLFCRHQEPGLIAFHKSQKDFVILVDQHETLVGITLSVSVH